MSTCFSARTADGTLVYFGDLDQNCAFPAPTAPAEAFTLTSGASAVAAGATSLTTVAVPSGVYIPPKNARGGWFLEFLAPNSSVPLLVELDNSSAIIAGATTLPVKALPQAIPAGSTAMWPLQLRGVTTRNYNRTINTIQSQASSETGFAGSTPGQQTAQIDLTIEVSDTAGYYNLRRIAAKRETAYVKIIFPQGSQNLKAEKVEGTAYIGSLNRTAQDNNIQTVTTTIALINEPTETYGLAAA